MTAAEWAGNTLQCAEILPRIASSWNLCPPRGRNIARLHATKTVDDSELLWHSARSRSLCI
jgi:hypothetical protein